MFVRRLRALTFLGTLSFTLVNCSSDDPVTPGSAGNANTAGTSSGGSTSGSGGASGGTPSAGTSSGGMTAGSAGKAGSASGGGGAATGGGGSGGASGGSGGSGGASAGSGGASGGSGGSTGGTFKLTSAEIVDGMPMAADYTCTSNMGFVFGGKGWGIAPSFKWENPPAGTMSYAFFMIDWTLTMGASSDVNGYHSAAWNIPTTLTSLNKGWMAADLGSAAKSINGAYLGPCPPNGPDTYHMIVMALPMASYTITGTGTAGVKSAYEMLKGVALATAELTGTYKQP